MRQQFKLTDPAFLATATNRVTTADLWAARVILNGGANPSAGTVSALQTFYNYLVANSLLSKIVACNCIVPDNLIASLTPLIVGPGLDPWTNHNFLAGDITVNGLQGANTKYLETGVNPSTALSTNSAGVTFYFKTSPNETKIDFGCNDGTKVFEFYNHYSDTTYWDCWNTNNDQGRLWVAQFTGTGYISANRKANNHSTVFWAAAGIAHFAMKTITGTTIGTAPNYSAFLFTSNGSGSPNANYSTKQISFCAIHAGWTEAESALFFTGIQALRTSLGGGYL